MNEKPESARSSTTASILRRCEDLLARGDTRGGLDLIATGKKSDPYLENARGVCLMRLGRSREAVELFRGLVLQGDSLSLADEVPPGFVTNFATALVLENNVKGALLVLGELHLDAYAAVGHLRDAIARWRAGLSWRARLSYSMYGTVHGPIDLGGPPGELVMPPAGVPTHAA